MKILVLSDDFPPRVNGGAAVVAARLVHAYVQKGHDVRVITTVRRREDVGAYEFDGTRIDALYSDYHIRWQGYRSLYNWSTVPEIRRIIGEFKPDVVHVHNIHYHLSYHALKLAKRSGARVILTAHDCMLFHYGKLREYIDFNDTRVPKKFDYRISPWVQFKTYKRRYNPFRNFAIRRYLRYCDRICAVSNALKDALEANGVHGAVVIHNGIDTGVWKPNTHHKEVEEARRAYKLEHKKVVFFAGRLSEAKGGKETVRILAQLVQKFPNITLLVAGSKEGYADTMQPLAHELHVAHAVVTSGWVGESQMRDLYEVSDVVVFPSEYLDVFGLVNIEAMAMEKPVVATCFGGAPEIVEDGVTGTIVNPVDVKSFSTAVEEFLRDAQKAREFGLAGRARVEQLFSLKEQVERYLKLFDEI